jgi:amino acid transporter
MATDKPGGKVSEPAGPEDDKSAAKRLFDLRWLIAGMFVVYGIVLIITGILDNAAEVAKAAGVRINLWTGIGMLITGLVFAAWARLRPLRPEG